MNEKKVDICDLQSQDNSDGQDSDGAENTFFEQNDAINPSPPPELLEAGSALAGDAIGDTVFSERWVLQALMKLTELIADKNKQELPVDDDDDEENVQELDKDIETQLCQLWDMTVTKDVVDFLLGLPTLDLIADAMAHTKLPRLTEIVVGIIGNMACNEDALDKITHHSKIKSSTLQLLDISDPPTLTEVFRLLLTCIQSKNHSPSWLKSFHEDEHFLPHLTFIMASSTNVTLLSTAAELIDYVLDISDDLCSAWSTSEFVDSLLEAVQQVGSKNLKAVETFLHVLQMLSTSNEGKVSLTHHTELVIKVVSQYFNYVCSSESFNILLTKEDAPQSSRNKDGFYGHEAGLASALLLVHILLLSTPENVLGNLDSKKTLTHIFKLIQLLGRSSRDGISEIKTESSSDDDLESEPKILQEILEGAVITLIEELLDNEKGGGVLLNAMGECKERQCRDVLTWLKLFPGGQRCFCQLQEAISANANSCNRLVDVLQNLESTKADSLQGDSPAGNPHNENG